MVASDLPNLFRLANSTISSALALTISLVSASSFAYDDTLTGDWGGIRSNMLAGGVSLDITNTGDFLVNSFGGIEDEATYSNLLEVSLNVDMETLVGIPGGTTHVLAMGTHGRDLGNFTGTTHAPSNLAAQDAFRVYEAWYEQSLFEDRVGVLVGLYAVDTEIDVIDTASIFINGAFGTGLDLSETGLNGPSIFPIVSFGGRLRIALTDSLSLRTAVVDGVPGNPNDAKSSAIRFDDGDGLLIMNELNFQPQTDRFLRFAIGSWLYTTEFDDLVDTRQDGSPRRRDGSYGIYGFAEGVIFSEKDDPEQGLSGFIRVGSADEDVNQIGNYYSGGLVYTGLLPGRDDDVLGFGFSVGVNGDNFKTAQSLAGSPVTDTEVALELTYEAQLLPWFVIQPVLQYYIDPGSNPELDDSLVSGFRFSISL